MDFAQLSLIHLGFGLLLLILWIAALIDLKTLTIPNELSFILIALWVPFAIFAIRSGYTAIDLVFQVLGGLAAFLVGVVLFAMRVMGGGDVKLVGALAPLLPIETLPWLFASIAIIGMFWGVLFVIGKYFFYKFGDEKLSLRKALKTKLPYGPAIAAGFTLYTFPLLSSTGIF